MIRAKRGRKPKTVRQDALHILNLLLTGDFPRIWVPSKYIHLTMRRGRKIANVAIARKLAVRLFWMMRQGWNYQQVMKFGSHVGQRGHRYGVP